LGDFVVRLIALAIGLFFVLRTRDAYEAYQRLKHNQKAGDHALYKLMGWFALAAFCFVFGLAPG
jgi:formate hydrogenlyase subunit 3/multisubunit Na+/H+ antiporter MnhD subunit